MIDQKILKLAVANAYMEGQKDGLLQGKIGIFKTLREQMERQGWNELPLKMIRALESSLNNEVSDE